MTLLGELWTVLAVTDDALFLIGKYGKIIQVPRDRGRELAA